MEQPLAGASGAADGRGHDGGNNPATVAFGASAGGLCGTLQEVMVGGRCPKPEFEHRLDERDEVGRRGQADGLELRHGLGDRQVRQIHRDDVDVPTARDGGPELRQVRALEVHHPGMATEVAAELTESRIQGKDLGGSVLEEHPSEPARGRTDVKADASCHLDAEGTEGCAKLVLTPEPARLQKADAGIGGNEGSTVGDDAPVDDEPFGGDRGDRIGDVGTSRADVRDDVDEPGPAAHGDLLSVRAPGVGTPRKEEPWFGGGRAGRARRNRRAAEGGDERQPREVR
jgi:hypothetical protein